MINYGRSLYSQDTYNLSGDGISEAWKCKYYVPWLSLKKAGAMTLVLLHILWTKTQNSCKLKEAVLLEKLSKLHNKILNAKICNLTYQFVQLVIFILIYALY